MTLPPVFRWSVLLLILLPFIDGCDQQIVSVCQKCQMWLEGMQLDCSGSNFTQVMDVLKSLNSPVQLLEIHNTEIESGILTGDIFDGIYIKQLDLSNNRIAKIEPGVFASQSDSLQLLRLANNSLNVFPDLAGLRQLQALDMSGNNLGAIPDKAFEDTPALKQLRLERNNICTLSPTALVETKTYLELLDLSDNCLSSVPAQNLRGAQRLMYLDLSNNKIGDIPSMQFMNMPVLKEVRLSRNRIGSMTPLSFMNVPNLQQLDLSRNRISNIPVNQYQGFQRIDTINLSHNELKRIGPSTFKDLKSLESLDLSMNFIDNIQTLAFSNCPRLQTLHLQNNQIDQLLRNAFDSLNQLLVLNLANNSLTTAGNGMFSGVPNLKQLNLRNNKIMNIEDNAFNQLRQLTTLDLGENSLSSIPKPAFRDLDKLFWLDLCCNDIETIKDGTFSRKVSNILLHSNPLVCDQANDAFINYLVVNNVRTFLPEQKEVVCSGPAELAGTRLNDVMISRANDTFFKTLNQLVPGNGLPSIGDTGVLLGNLVPGLDAIPGLTGGIPGLTTTIPGLNEVSQIIPGLRDLPGINAITNPFGSAATGLGSDFDSALNDFVDPLSRVVTGSRTNSGDVSDFISSIPNLIGQLPNYPQIDLANIPPEMINTVLSGGTIPGVPKAISDSMLRQYMQRLAATAQASNRGLPAPANGVTEMPPLTSLPPQLLNDVLAGQNLPGLSAEQTNAIKDHYLNKIEEAREPSDLVTSPGENLAPGESLNLSPAELLRFLPQGFDLSILPPTVLQDLAAGKTPKLSDLPQSLLDSLTQNAEFNDYIKTKEEQARQKPQKPFDGLLNPDDILAQLPPTNKPDVTFDETYLPYDIATLDRQTDLKAGTEPDNTMTAVYVAIALALIGTMTLGTLGYFCWKKRNGTLPGVDDFDRSKLFGISPKSSYEHNSLPFHNPPPQMQAPAPNSFMLPPPPPGSSSGSSNYLDLYGGNNGGNGWNYNRENAPGNRRTEM